MSEEEKEKGEVEELYLISLFTVGENDSFNEINVSEAEYNTARSTISDGMSHGYPISFYIGESRYMYLNPDAISAVIVMLPSKSSSSDRTFRNNKIHNISIYLKK